MEGLLLNDILNSIEMIGHKCIKKKAYNNIINKRFQT